MLAESERIYVMKKILSELKLRINESPSVPCEGIFWIIDDVLVAFKEQVDTTGSWSTTFEHKNIWEEIKNKYKVNNKCVQYDYFPRGRIMVNPVRKNGLFEHYDAWIYIDNCINTVDIVDDIKYEFNLTQCNLRYVGSDGGITNNHYQCHNCKSKKEDGNV